MSYGPIDFIALEFKTDQLTGESLPALLELVQKQIVRVIDLVIILKDQDGETQVLEIEELAPDMMAIFDPLDWKSAASSRSKILSLLQRRWRITPPPPCCCLKTCGRSSSGKL